MSTPTTDPVELHEPIRISSKQKPADDVEMVTLVIVDDVEYKIPARPRANLALRQLQLVRELGADLANVGLLQELMGVTAFDALANCDEMTPDQLKDISRAAMRLTMGALEDVSGN